MPKWMPGQDIDDVGRLECMYSLASLGASDMNAPITIFVQAVGATDICAVKAEGQAVNTTSHGRQGVLADPVVRVPESDQRVSSAYCHKVTVGTVLNTVGGTSVCVECVKE